MGNKTKHERKVFNIHVDGQAVQEAWVKVGNIYCYKCGKQHVWQKDNGYNKTIAKLCTNCGSTFSLADLSTPGEFYKTEQRVKFIET